MPTACLLLATAGIFRGLIFRYILKVPVLLFGTGMRFLASMDKKLIKKASLLILREPSADSRTFGALYFNGRFFCHTLEDQVRLPGEKKVFGETAIPAGTYKVIINTSTRFKRLMPLLLNVPDFAGVRLHGGNTEKDTHGCPLVAYKRGINKIWETAEADLTLKLLEFDEIEITLK